MLTIRLVVVDRTRNAFLKEGEEFYIKRIKRYARLEWIEVKPEGKKAISSPEDAMVSEGKAIARKLVPRQYVISLDREGRALDSIEFARLIERLSMHQSGICFIIGGALGISREVLERSNERISLSRMILTHEMARMVLLEQLYRVFTILNNEKYHK